jgi:transposase
LVLLALRKILRYFSAVCLNAPDAKRQALILELDMQGLTRSKIALSVGVGQATVYRVLASSKKS